MQDPDVDDVEARGQQTGLDLRVDARRRQPAVAPQRDSPRAHLKEVIADRPPQRAGDVVGKISFGDAADVVFAENARIHDDRLPLRHITPKGSG